MIEFDLENRKIFKREKHPYFKPRVEEIRFEDVGSVEQERMYDPNGGSFETDLILKAKGYDGSSTIKKAGLSQKKLEQVIGLTR